MCTCMYKQFHHAHALAVLQNGTARVDLFGHCNMDNFRFDSCAKRSQASCVCDHTFRAASIANRTVHDQFLVLHVVRVNDAAMSDSECFWQRVFGRSAILSFITEYLRPKRPFGWPFPLRPPCELARPHVVCIVLVSCRYCDVITPGARGVFALRMLLLAFASLSFALLGRSVLLDLYHDVYWGKLNMYACLRACVCLYVFVYLSMHVCMYLSIHVSENACTGMNECVHVCRRSSACFRRGWWCTPHHRAWYHIV